MILLQHRTCLMDVTSKSMYVALCHSHLPTPEHTVTTHCTHVLTQYFSLYMLYHRKHCLSVHMLYCAHPVVGNACSTSCIVCANHNLLTGVVFAYRQPQHNSYTGVTISGNPCLGCNVTIQTASSATNAPSKQSELCAVPSKPGSGRCSFWARN